MSLSDAELAAAVDQLAGARVLCIGDVMLDRFVYGKVERISPEAPIPVLAIEREVSMLGGSGNVVRNLAALGVETAFITVLGDDQAAREVTHLIAKETGVEPHLLVEPRRRTTIKTRFVGGSQQILRADHETIAAVRPMLATDLIGRAGDACKDCAVVVLSDYGKGVLDLETTRGLIACAREHGLPVIVDPKGKDYAARYAGATLLTPNRRELAEATGMPVGNDAEIVAACRHLISTCNIEGVLATRSQEGMTLVLRQGSPSDLMVRHYPAEAREVFDVSGAGDTVLATLAAAIAADLSWETACHLANVAAGIVVGKVGTAAVLPREIQAALQNHALMSAEAKVVNRTRLLELTALWRGQGLKIGFTNGCFDLLHPGHVSLLAQARKACDRLVVGLNSDASVKRLKGETRPVQHEGARALVLASLASVDLVSLFSEDTPLELIKSLRPDVLVKGADYTVATVVGADIVQGYGGRVVLAELTPGQSTTAMIGRMQGDG